MGCRRIKMDKKKLKGCGCTFAAALLILFVVANLIVLISQGIPCNGTFKDIHELVERQPRADIYFSTKGELLYKDTFPGMAAYYRLYVFGEWNDDVENLACNSNVLNFIYAGDYPSLGKNDDPKNLCEHRKEFRIEMRFDPDSLGPDILNEVKAYLPYKCVYDEKTGKEWYDIVADDWNNCFYCGFETSSGASYDIFISHESSKFLMRIVIR